MDQFDKMLAKFQPAALSLFRFFTGLLLFQYGIAKIFKFPVLPYFANIPPLITAAGAIELVLGALLMVGLFTRIAAFILSGRNGVRLFPRPHVQGSGQAGVPAAAQWRHGGDPVLLRLSVSGDGRRRTDQRRRDAEEVTEASYVDGP